MKKTSLVLLSLVLAGSAFAEDLLTAEEHPVLPVGISLVTPIQYPASNVTIDGFRWDIVYGESFGVNGLDLTLVGASHANSTGLQINGLAGVNNLDFTGCQISGLGSIVLGSTVGCQISGLASYNRGGFTGLQIAPFNWDGSSCGLQLGAINLNNGISSGLQLGAYNGNGNEYHGWSVGAVNYTCQGMEGLQVGLLNIIPQAGKGVQLGVVNSAVNFKGVQIGVLNLIGNGTFQVLPLVNANF